MEKEFKELAPDEYTKEFHAKALEMIPRLLFEMRLLILDKMARLFEIEDQFQEVTKPMDMTEVLVTLEKMMKDTWEMVVLRMKVEDAKETWGELRTDEEIFEEFKIHNVLDGVEEELGTEVNDEFYEKAIKITERIKEERITEIKEYLRGLSET